MAVESPPVFNIEGPLLIPPPRGTIRGGHYFQGFKPLVCSLGGDSRQILERLGIDPAATDDPDYPLSCTAGVAILEYCARRFNDSLFGLHLADKQDADVFGSLYTLARAAPTLRAAIESLVSYIPVLHHPGGVVEFVSAKETAVVRFCPHADIALDEQAISHGLLVNVKLLEALVGRDFRLSYVNAIADISPRTLEFMEDRFRCKVRAKASANEIGLGTNQLDRPLKSANRLLFGLLDSYLSGVKKATSPTLANRVEAYVRNELSSGNCSLERCAAELGTTSRTLHRRLARRSLNFSDILERQRSEAAMRILLETDYSIDKVAHSLGYAEQSSFARAFKRWTRTTPQAYREGKTAVAIDPRLSDS